MDLIIYAHPDREKSHNAAVLRFVRETLEAKGAQYGLIDLYAEGFQPVLSAEEYAGGKAVDAKVAECQQKIAGAERLIFIYPIWWYGAPAMLKGFFDRVFTPGFAYNFRKAPAIPPIATPIMEAICGQGACYPLFLKNLPVDKKLVGKKALAINTYGGNRMGFELFGRAPEFSMDKAVLNFCGVEPVVRVNWFEARGPAEVPQALKEEIRKALE